MKSRSGFSTRYTPLPTRKHATTSVPDSRDQKARHRCESRRIAPITSPVTPPTRRTACRQYDDRDRQRHDVPPPDLVPRRRLDWLPGLESIRKATAPAQTTAVHAIATKRETDPATNAPMPSVRAAGMPVVQAHTIATRPVTTPTSNASTPRCTSAQLDNAATSMPSTPISAATPSAPTRPSRMMSSACVCRLARRQSVDGVSEAVEVQTARQQRRASESPARKRATEFRTPD